MISDDDLILYYYRDGLDAAERARIGAALVEQPELAHRLHTLVARLDAAAAMPEVPVPAQTQQRWQAAIEGSKTRKAPASRPFLAQPRWLAAAASVVLVALVFGLRNQWTQDTVAVAPPEADSTSEASAYENGLKWHLASTERRLASLGDATPEEREQLVEAIIGQNRIYALAAERAGEPQLARVLRAFTPILEGVADGHGESTASSVAQLSFELRIMQARLAANAAPPNSL